MNQKARAQLRVLGTCIVQSRRGVNEVPLRQSIVCLLHTNKIVVMKLNRNTHPHMLRALTWKQVALLKGLETKVVKHKVT